MDMQCDTPCPIGHRSASDVTPTFIRINWVFNTVFIQSIRRKCSAKDS